MDVMSRRASLWFKVGSIFTDDLHNLICATNFFVRWLTWLSHHLSPISDLFHNFLFPMQGAKEHASLSSPSFALLYILISSWVYLEVHWFFLFSFVFLCILLHSNACHASLYFCLLCFSIYCFNLTIQCNSPFNVQVVLHLHFQLFLCTCISICLNLKLQAFLHLKFSMCEISVKLWKLIYINNCGFALSCSLCIFKFIDCLSLSNNLIVVIGNVFSLFLCMFTILI